MAQTETVARPYARAVFGRAVNQAEQKQWLEFLKISAELLNNSDVIKRLGLPSFVHDWKNWLNQLLSEKRRQALSQEESNFLNLLEEHNRLIVLPQIAELYERLLYEQDNVCLVQVQSAQTLTPAEVESLTQTLKRKIGRNVLLKTSVNPELIAGVLIEYDGQVIDQTLKGRIATFARLLD